MALQQFSRSLPMMLYRALDAVMPRFRATLNAHGITEQQWRVLRVLWEVKRIKVRELAAIALIPAPSLVGIVERLVAAGYVTRVRSTEDRRSVFVSATPAGRTLMQGLLPEIATTYADLKQSVEPQTWQDLLAGLDCLAQLQPPPHRD